MTKKPRQIINNYKRGEKCGEMCTLENGISLHVQFYHLDRYLCNFHASFTLEFHVTFIVC